MRSSLVVLYVHSRSRMKAWSHAIKMFFSFMILRDWCDLAMCAFCMHFMANTCNLAVVLIVSFYPTIYGHSDISSLA